MGGPGAFEWMSFGEVEVMGRPAAPYADRLATDLAAVMRGRHARALLRIPVAPAPFPVDRWRLQADFDDAFVASLDAEAVAHNVEGEPVLELASADLALPGGPEAELLSVELHNVAADDDDLFFGAELVAQSIETGAPAFFPTPTPGAPNGLGVLGFVDTPTAQPPRGLYDAPQQVNVVSATPGATLIYTLDGSPPAVGNGVVVPALDPASGPSFSLEVAATSTLRALAIREGWASSAVATHTYLFLDQVVRQPAAPVGLPAVWDGLAQGPIAGDYEMDPEIVDGPGVREALERGLRAIPSLSIVTEQAALFGAERGIYVHSQQRGSEWERAASIEILDGAEGFQADAGLRIHGWGWRPHSNTRKHAFRLEFRRRYGPSRMHYPLFPDAPIDSFDSVVLRSQGSRGWQDFRDPEQSQYIRDAFARDSARDMGKADGHAAYVHLYLNGLYWGLYMAVERPDADFGAAYFGGEAEEYDAINRRTVTNEAIDGTLDALLHLMELADGPVDTPEGLAAVEAMIDLDDLIDYMLLQQYTSNRDGPHGGSHNNMRAVYRRHPEGRFRFFVWDMEYSLWFADDAAALDVDVPDSIAHVYARLRLNPDFRARYGARAMAHLSGEGALTPAAARARYDARATEIFDALLAESARWGDAKRAVPYRRDVEWAEEYRRLTEEYFPRRSGVLIEQLRARDLYPQ